MESSHNEEKDQNPPINHRAHLGSSLRRCLRGCNNTHLTTDRGAVDPHPDGFSAYQSSANRRDVDGGR